MKVLVVQSRPYQAFAGGDGAYTDALVRHLEQIGCTVSGITSGTTRGRPRAWLTLAYPGAKGSAWRFRSTLRIGRIYLALGPQLLRDVASFIAARFRAAASNVSPFAVLPGRAEQAWIHRELRRDRPDLVILTFEAVGAIDVVRKLRIPALALVGFLPIRSYVFAAPGPLERADLDRASPFLDMMRRADWIAFSSRDDCNFARDRLGVVRPVYVGMGIERKRRQTLGDQRLLLFVGNKTEPNRGAVAWFLKDIWPAIRAAVPGVRFRIVGRVGHAFRSDPHAGIECPGEVASLTDEYCAARLVVAPLTSGSAGVKTKVAEAISYGCPIVSTSLGVDAADARQIDRAGYIADDAAAFARHVIDLLTDRELWQAKQAGTAAVFDELFSREAAYRELTTLLETLGSAGPAPCGEGNDAGATAANGHTDGTGQVATPTR